MPIIKTIKQRKSKFLERDNNISKHAVDYPNLLEKKTSQSWEKEIKHNTWKACRKRANKPRPKIE